MDLLKYELLSRSADIPYVKNKNEDLHTAKNEIHHEAVYFTGISNADNRSSVKKPKITDSCMIKESEIMGPKNKPIVVDPDAFDIEPLKKSIGGDRTDKSEVKFGEICASQAYRKRWTRITLSPVERISSRDMPFELDPRKIHQTYRECLDELKAKIPKYYGTSKPVINTYHKLKKCAFYKRRMSSNPNENQSVKRSRYLSNEISVCVTDNTKMIFDDSIALENEEGTVLTQSIMELDSSSRSNRSSTVSNVPIATVKSSRQEKNTQCLSSERDNLPELLAEAVGSHLNVPFQAKKSIIKLQKCVEKKTNITESTKLTTQVEEYDDEYGVVSSSMNSAIKKLKIPKIKPTDICVVSSTNNCSLTRDEDIVCENIPSSPPNNQIRTEEKMPTLPRVPTRICSAKSPRISRVVSTDTLRETDGLVKTVSDSSLADENVSTDSILKKLERIRANFRADSSRKFRRASGKSYSEKCKRRKYGNTPDLSFLSDTDQESDITASTLDDDELDNDINNMHDSLMTRNESERRSTHNVSSRTYVEKNKDPTIPVISSSTRENKSYKEIMQDCHTKREFLRTMSTDSQSNEQREETGIVVWESKKKNRDSCRISIDSGISVQGASPAQSPRSTETVEISKKNVNDQNVGIHPELKKHSCVSPSQPSSKRQSLGLDDLLRHQTRLEGILDQFMSVGAKSVDEEDAIPKKASKIASNSTLSSLPDSSTIDTGHDKHPTDRSLITVLPERKILAHDNFNLQENGECNSNEKKHFNSPINNKTQEGVIVPESTAIIDGNLNKIFIGNSSEITLISKAHSSHDTSSNKNEAKTSDAVVNSQLEGLHPGLTKETYKQEGKTILNKSSLPPKKRPIINSNDDNKRVGCISSPAPTRLCTIHPKELDSKWDCAIPASTSKCHEDGNKPKVPANRNINPVQVLQILSTTFIANQPQPSVQLQAPMQLQYQVQPPGLVVNVAATTQQSNTILADHAPPPYPIGILSYVQQTDESIAPTTSKSAYNPGIASLSLSTPSTSSFSSSTSKTTATLGSIHTLSATSTTVASEIVTSKSVPLLSVPPSSTQSPSNHPKVSLNNQISVDYKLITSPVLTKSPQLNAIDRARIEYLNYIVRSFAELREYMGLWSQNEKTRNHPTTQLYRQNLSMKYESLVASVIAAITAVGQLLNHSSINETLTFISTHSVGVMPNCSQITFAELEGIYNGHSKIFLQSPDIQNRNQPTTNYPCSSQMRRPLHPNINNSMTQNIPGMIVLLPPPPPSSSSAASTSYNGHPGITGSMLQPSLMTNCPMTVPPLAVPIPQKSRTRLRSKPSLISTSQSKTLKNQISTYRKIYRWMQVEREKYMSAALHNESLRQLQQQEIIAIEQQQQQQQLRERYQQLQAHLTICRDRRCRNEQQEPQIDNNSYEQRDNGEVESSHPQPVSESVQIKRRDRNNTHSITTAISSIQAAEQLLTTSPTINKLQISRRNFLATTTMESSFISNAMVPENESQVVSSVSCQTATTTKTATTMMSIPSTNGENNRNIADVKENTSVLATTVRLERGHSVSGGGFLGTSQVDELRNSSSKSAVNEHELNLVNNSINVNDEQMASIVDGSNGYRHIKSELQAEQEQQHQEQHLNQDMIELKEELPLKHEMKVENESYDTKNSPCNTDPFKASQNYNFTYTNDQSTITELITLDDSLTDDDIDCISIISSHKGTVTPFPMTEVYGINYNQASIDEEIECEALSKKLGIQGPSYEQNTSFIKADIPLISGVTSIDKDTFEGLNEESDKSLLINEDIIDITDSGLKFERNPSSPHSGDDITVMDFIGVNIEGSASRLNCSNCNSNKVKIACECEEIMYCSDQCIRVHWPEFHAHICKGPPINITEITLDDD